MTGGWKYAAASVIGTSHLSAPQGLCQDAHECAYLRNADVLVCVVSDGAGSASHSDEGSRLACEMVLLRSSLSETEALHSRTFALATLSLIREELMAAANRGDVRLRDFACTLLVAIVGRQQATFWQIGDGAICFRNHSESEFHYAFWPAKGEYANVTHFVTDARADEELEFDTAHVQIADIAVFSDGLERLALDFKNEEVHSAFFKALFPYLHRRPEGRLSDVTEQMQAFLGSARVNERTDDDKTLILATVETDNAT